VFNGLVGDQQIGTGTSGENIAAFFAGNGFLSLTTKADGTFTGSLRLEGKSLPVKGKFASGAASITIKRTGKTNAVVALNFDSTASGKITGTVTTGGSPMAVTALPGVYTGSKPSIHPLSGKRYTVVLPAPDTTLGHGYATLVVATSGTATLAGKLADGTTYTTASRTVDDGSRNWLVPVHIPLYTGSSGMLVGEVLLPKPEPADSPAVAGSLGWLLPANTTAAMFPGGFLKLLEPTGESYQMQKGISLFSGTAASVAFTLTVDPQSWILTDPLSLVGLWQGSNVPILSKPAKMTFTPTTGVFKGSFLRKVNGKSVSTPYEGAIFASPLTLPDGTSPVRGGGFFSTGTASGPVEIE